MALNGKLSKLVLKGFKSIADCELKMRPLNILIGSNGAGKSNFITFFRMIQQLLDGNLQQFVSQHGGPDSILHFGRKVTGTLSAELHFGNNGYKVSLEATQDNRMMIAEEGFWWDAPDGAITKIIGRGHFESKAEEGTGTKIDKYVVPVLKKWRVYHFHDTSDSAYVKRIHRIADNAYLRSDAGNLAAFLYFLQQVYPKEFSQIVQTIRLVAPFFGQFRLRPNGVNGEMIELEWFERGEDIPFKAHHLSDGTLRFICLATVFLQPADLQPETILVDEPELGLHPYAITTLASLIRSASKSKQVIVSTQSVELLNEFDPEDVVVVDKDEGGSVFKRLDTEELRSWLQDYSLGELWKKNLLGGRPSR
jgi:predicted ATPase